MKPGIDGVIDAHCRIGRGRDGDRDVDAALREMDACGVARALVCPMDPFVAVRNAEGNDFVAGAVKAHADRFVGCAVTNPWYGPDAVGELERAFDLGLKALFLCPPVQGFQLSDPLVDETVHLACERDVPIYAHTGTPVCSEPFQLTALAQRHPTGKFIMGHMGFADFWYDAAQAAAMVDNIYLETSLVDGDVIAQALKQIGASRLVFGSDAPVSALDIELAKAMALEASPKELQCILRTNLEGLLR